MKTVLCIKEKNSCNDLLAGETMLMTHLAAVFVMVSIKILIMLRSSVIFVFAKKYLQTFCKMIKKEDIGSESPFILLSKAT